MKNKILTDKRACVVLLISLVTSFSFISMTKNCFSSAMVFIVDAGLLTKFETGTISALFYVVYAILQMLSGSLIDKWHPERFITIGLIGASISNLIIYFNQNYVVMLASWIFNAVAQCAVWPAVFKIASSVICDSMRGASLFFINISGAVGGICSYILAAIVSSDWQVSFLFSSIGLFLIAILWEIIVRALKPRFIEREHEPEMLDSPSSRKNEYSFRQIIIPAGLIPLFVIAIFRSAFDLGTKALAPSIINESYEAVSPEFATLLSIVIIAAGVLGTLFGSVIYPKFIRNEALAILLFFVLTLPFGCLLLLVGRINYVWVVIFLAVMVFLLNSASMFTSSFIAGRFNRWNMGATVAAFVNGGAALGIVLANMLFTAIADAKGWYFTIFVWICVIAFAILLSLTFFIIWSKFLKKIRGNENK